MGVRHAAQPAAGAGSWAWPGRQQASLPGAGRRYRRCKLLWSTCLVGGAVGGRRAMEGVRGHGGATFVEMEMCVVLGGLGCCHGGVLLPWRCSWGGGVGDTQTWVMARGARGATVRRGDYRASQFQGLSLGSPTLRRAVEPHMLSTTKPLLADDGCNKTFPGCISHTSMLCAAH